MITPDKDSTDSEKDLIILEESISAIGALFSKSALEICLPCANVLIFVVVQRDESDKIKCSQLEFFPIKDLSLSPFSSSPTTLNKIGKSPKAERLFATLAAPPNCYVSSTISTMGMGASAENLSMLPVKNLSSITSPITAIRLPPIWASNFK